MLCYMYVVLPVGQVKVIKMLVTVVVVFAFSWLPLYVVHLRLYYGPIPDPSSLEFSLLVQVSPLFPEHFPGYRHRDVQTSKRMINVKNAKKNVTSVKKFVNVE